VVAVALSKTIGWNSAYQELFVDKQVVV
jgi:hypothetical protein